MVLNDPSDEPFFPFTLYKIHRRYVYPEAFLKMQTSERQDRVKRKKKKKRKGGEESILKQSRNDPRRYEYVLLTHLLRDVRCLMIKGETLFSFQQ